MNGALNRALASISGVQRTEPAAGMRETGGLERPPVPACNGKNQRFWSLRPWSLPGWLVPDLLPDPC